MSDDGKQWFKVTGLAAGDAYTFQRSEEEAREAVGRGYLDAAPVPEEEAVAYFTRLVERASAPPPEPSRARRISRMLRDRAAARDADPSS
jgi:hypothetical protein